MLPHDGARMGTAAEGRPLLQGQEEISGSLGDPNTVSAQNESRRDTQGAVQIEQQQKKSPAWAGLLETYDSASVGFSQRLAVLCRWAQSAQAATRNVIHLPAMHIR